MCADLGTAGAGLVRLRAPEADGGGSIALSRGVTLYREAENLLLAAACAASDRRCSYHPRKIAEVRDHLDNIRLGRTEIGSDVAPIRAPVAPALRPAAQRPLMADLEDAPFPRAVTLKLAPARHPRSCCV